MGRTESAAHTRSLVIHETIKTIADIGYYRTTSNEIARRSGVTWGVIQYHFGSREGLLLAVIEDAVDEVIARFANAVIKGDTVDERLDSWVSLIFDYYGRAEYISVLQVLLDVARDPNTAEDARATLRRFGDSLSFHVDRLLHEIIPGRTAEPGMAAYLHMATWGVAVSTTLAVMMGDRFDDEHAAHVRAVLVEAATAHVNSSARSPRARRRTTPPKKRS